MRVVAGCSALFAVVMLAGSFSPDHPEERGIVMVLTLFSAALSALLFVRAHQRSKRSRMVSLDRRLLALAQGTGILTVPHVVAALSLTSDEAKAALSQLSKDGLAEFDVDAEGAPIYRVRKLPPAK
jgi:hypothetical protein